jgi:SAM-dependent methyltransferase
VPAVWHENYWFQRHLAAYRALVALLPLGRTPGDHVLEAGCGEGYGAALLAQRCDHVHALDYDEATVAHVRRAYPQVRPVRGNLVALPFTSGSMAAVVSLQTVEHLWDQPGFVAECVRVLRPAGHLALSTPNRLTFSPGLEPGQRPRNPFHTRELDAAELFDLLHEHAEVELMAGLRHGARVERWEAARGSIVEAQLARPYDEWDEDLADTVRGLTAEDFTLEARELAESLDLIAVASPRRT